MTTTDISPNTSGAVTEQTAVPSLDSIAAKMTAMREQTERNQIRVTEQTATGADEESSSPVAPDSDDVPEIDESNSEEEASDDQENLALDESDDDQVSETSTDTTADELIDFVEFANDNPNAKFKFMRNGKEVVIDAKKAAAILGQGSAIHEEARQLKVDKAEFDEYINETRARQEGLTLAMQFTVEPRLKGAYDEIVKTQNYQATFNQQLQQTRDPAQVARIRASMQQNEQYIRQQQAVIQQLQPAVEQFRQVRSQQVAERLDSARKSFTDKELRNEYVFNEIRDKLTKIWKHARDEVIPGVPNLDLITSDENILSLLRDGLKYRTKPNTKAAGASMAQLTSRKGSSSQQKSNDELSKLREQANKGDKKAADNLLVQRLQSIRGSRGSR